MATHMSEGRSSQHVVTPTTSGMHRAVELLAYVFVFTIPFENLIIVPGLGTLTRLIGTALSGSWILLSLVEREYRKPAAAHSAIYLFITWSMITTIWTRATGFSIIRMSTYFQLFLLVFIVWNLFDKRHVLRGALQAYVLGCFVTISVLAFNFINGNVSRWQRRASIANSDENDIGLVLALMLPIAWHLATSSATVSRSKLTILNFAAVPLGMLGIFLTVSRGSLLATLPFFASLVFTIPSIPARQRPIVALATPAVLAAALFAVPASSWTRILEIGEQVEARNLSSRYEIWVLGLVEWLDTPSNMLFGIGVGAYPWVIGKVAHNTALEILVETGLFGLVLYVGVLALVFYAVMRASQPVRIMWLTVLATLMVGTLSLSWQFEKPFWLFIAFAITHSAASQRQLDQPHPRHGVTQ